MISKSVLRLILIIAMAMSMASLGVFADLSTYELNNSAHESKDSGTDGDNHPIEIKPSKLASLEAIIVTHEKFLIVVFTLLIAIFTLALWLATQTLATEARESGEGQAERTEKSLQQAAKAAIAMENLAKATSSNSEAMQSMWRQQFRAYLGADPGIAGAQEGQQRFRASVKLTNHGLTPARNISYKARLGILPTNLPKEHVFLEPGEKRVTDSGIAPKQIFSFDWVMDHSIPESEVAGAMQGVDSRLYMWGTIYYEDVYDNNWLTNFCFTYTFFMGEDGFLKFNHFYHHTHNNFK